MGQHVCPNGHQVPVLLEVECASCQAGVAYEPCSIGMALYRTVEQLQGVVQDARDAGEASMQAAFWRARALELGASEDEYRDAAAGWKD